MQATAADKASHNVLSSVRLGTRTSQLALWQTNHVAAQLQHHWHNLQCELVHHVTQGDKRLDRPLPEIGGKGLFTAELEEALRRGEIDIAVHSLKDLPVEDAPDLILGAILSREDTRDVLVCRQPWTLATLPTGAVVGTSSLRRQAQLLAVRPDLQVRSIRGNVDTRIRKVMEGEYDAAILAGAGLTRLGLTHYISEWLAYDVMLPAPGQGALAVQCRSGDGAVLALLAPIHDADAAATTATERHLLLRLGGGCSAPIGAWAQIEGDQIALQARIGTTDGRSIFDASAMGREPHQVADLVARALLERGAQIALSRESGETSLPLAGKRIVVTRPARLPNEGRDEFSVKLEASGAQPIEIPAIRLESVTNNIALANAVSHLSGYDWVIFTSPNAVEHFFANAEDLVSQARWSAVRVAAVGPATRDALLAHGVSTDAMPEQFMGSQIVDALGEIAGKHVLLPRSAMGAIELPAALKEHGATVDEIALYTPVSAEIGEDAKAMLLAGVDVVTFASGSAVRAFAGALRGDPRFAGFWLRVTVACIGLATADVARAEGVPVHLVAAEHTIPGLLSVLIAYFQPEPKDA